MSISNIFPSTILSDTEKDIVIELLSNPTLKKYLTSMAMEDTKELLSLSAIGNTGEVITRAHATVQGKLQVVGTLLSISNSKEQQ